MSLSRRAPRRAGRNRAACRASSAADRNAARTATSKASGRDSTTRSAFCPTEPVEPKMATRRTIGHYTTRLCAGQRAALQRPCERDRERRVTSFRELSERRRDVREHAAGRRASRTISARCSSGSGLAWDARRETPLDALLQSGRFATLLPELVSRLRRGRHADDAPAAGPSRPIVRPGKILALGRTYREHALELGNAPPADPLVFDKLPDAIVGNGRHGRDPGPRRGPPRPRGRAGPRGRNPRLAVTGTETAGVRSPAS